VVGGGGRYLEELLLEVIRDGWEALQGLERLLRVQLLPARGWGADEERGKVRWSRVAG